MELGKHRIDVGVGVGGFSLLLSSFWVTTTNLLNLFHYRIGFRVTTSFPFTDMYLQSVSNRVVVGWSVICCCWHRIGVLFCYWGSSRFNTMCFSLLSLSWFPPCRDSSPAANIYFLRVIPSPVVPILVIVNALKLMLSRMGGLSLITDRSDHRNKSASQRYDPTCV